MMNSSPEKPRRASKGLLGALSPGGIASRKSAARKETADEAAARLFHAVFESVFEAMRSPPAARNVAVAARARLRPWT